MNSDIIKFALQMEADGKRFYERAAAKATRELKEIFTYLAEEEQRHYELFARMQAGDLGGASKALKGASLSSTKNIFIDFIENGSEAEFGDSVRSTWKEAQKFEQKAVELYSRAAADESDPDRRALLERIADEERNHVYLIDNMLAFMSDPQGFVDSRQFGDFRSWEGH